MIVAQEGLAGVAGVLLAERDAGVVDEGRGRGLFEQAGAADQLVVVHGRVDGGELLAAALAFGVGVEGREVAVAAAEGSQDEVESKIKFTEKIVQLDVKRYVR